MVKSSLGADPVGNIIPTRIQPTSLVNPLSQLKPQNMCYLQHQIKHRQSFSCSANWYQWQPQKRGKDRLFKQNDRAYWKHVRKIPGLHELHLAEELHRFYELAVYYEDQESKVKLDPSIPPMGDPYNFHGSKWPGKKFDLMWEYWMRCYPAHARDIEQELSDSRHEVRKAWWDLKNNSRVIIKESTNKRSRPDDTIDHSEVIPIRKEYYPIRSLGYFERTYMEPPCRVCGSTEHPALREKEDEYGDVTYHYCCPMAQEDLWETWYMRPCPIKMAAYCNHDEHEVLKAWHQMSYDGWGQHQTSRTLRLFLRMAYKACREDKG